MELGITGKKPGQQAQTVTRNTIQNEVGYSPEIKTAYMSSQQAEQLVTTQPTINQSNGAMTSTFTDEAYKHMYSQSFNHFGQPQSRQAVAQCKSTGKQKSLRKHIQTYTPVQYTKGLKPHSNLVGTSLSPSPIKQVQKKNNSNNNIPNFQTFKQSYYYKQLFTIKGNQVMKYDDGRTLDDIQKNDNSVSPYKSERDNTFQGLSRALTADGGETSYMKNFYQSHYNNNNSMAAQNEKMVNISNFTTNNCNGNKSGNQTKRTDTSNSLLMGILNIKQMSRQAMQEDHSSEDIISPKEQKDQVTMQQNMHKSMNAFFSKRISKEKRNMQFQNKTADDISPMKNGRSINLESLANATRKDHQLQEQRRIFESLGIKNDVYRKDETVCSVTKLTSYNNLSFVNTKQTLNQYQKKEKQFEKVYQDKLLQLRKASTDVKAPNYMNGKKTQATPDIALYKERNDPYKVISNRIRTRAQMVDRKYVHRNVKILEKFFDPLRIKLRVMPIARAPLVQGKNADFYFVEACKLGLRGDLTNAIEMLKKGLELKATHFLCRFNHGALMFKLGLIQEALSDFEMITQQLFCKEPAAFYNLAICYVQTGQYEEAVKACDKALSNNQEDRPLFHDTYRLKGICKYRLEQPIEAIKNFNAANRYRQDLNAQPRTQEEISRDLECIYISLFIEETRHLFNDPEFQSTLLKESKSQTTLTPLIFDLQQFKRFGSQKNLDVRTQKDLSPMRDKDNQHIIKEESNRSFSENSSLNFENAMRPKANSLSKIMKRTNMISPPQQRDSQSPTVKFKRMNTVKSNSNSPMRRQQTNSGSSKGLMQLKQLIGASPRKAKIDAQTLQMKKLEDEYYQQLKGMTDYNVNAGTKLRYDKIYRDDPLNNEDLSKEEREELEKRQRIEQELEKDQGVKYVLSEQEKNDKFLSFLLGMHTIKERQVDGTQNDAGIKQVAKEQVRLENMMKNLNQNFEQKEIEWDKEFEKAENQIFNNSIIEDGKSEDSEDEFGEQAQEQKRKDTIVEKLNETLHHPDITPDDVQNILVRDLEEKQRNEAQSKYKNLKSSKRLTLRQVDIIRKEMDVPDFTKRNVKRLDKALKNLKFFKRFEEDIRQKIYLNLEFISLPAQTTIFKQGDVGDKLYIILKGRVAVQINSAEYGNLPVVVATLNDGAQFGELSLISLDKLEDHSKQPSEVSLAQKAPQQAFARRKATCITVEQTELLALPKEFSVQLYQPSTTGKKNSPSRRALSKNDSKTKSNKTLDTQDDQDDLNKKILFLQSLSIFEEIDAQLLMPIACNMIPVTYNFGEYIIKEGEVPKGLYIIKSGQCKVASTRIADRTQHVAEFLCKKLGIKKKIKDKDPLFNNFDADNSLLNEVKTLQRGFQNDRVYVTEDGEQVRDKIVFQDIMTFSQLMPKNFFGGRALLPFEMYRNLRRIYYGREALERFYPKGTSQEFIDNESEEKYQLKSLLSVIADSGTVELYILDKSDMGYIPDYILRKVFEKIAMLKEADRPFHLSKIEEIKEQMIKWQSYKVDYIDKMLKERHAEKNKDKIK